MYKVAVDAMWIEREVTHSKILVDFAWYHNEKLCYFQIFPDCLFYHTTFGVTT